MWKMSHNLSSFQKSPPFSHVSRFELRKKATAWDQNEKISFLSEWNLTSAVHISCADQQNRKLNKY